MGSPRIIPGLEAARKGRAMTVAEIFEQTQSLTLQERKELMKLMIDDMDAPETQDEEHSILELEGLGAELWQGIDPQEFIKQLRSEWDHRP
jgi:hypothetical protein